MSAFDYDPDEADPEYIAQQRARRSARRPVRTVPLESAEGTAKPYATPAPKPTRTLAKALCKAQSTVRYPKDHENPELRGKPILDADGARQYRPCERPPMAGQEVCQMHGGLAGQAQAAAKRRLLQATEPLIAELIAIARDNRLPAADRTRAINSALDRAGFRGGVEINVEAPAWQRMLKEWFEEADAADRQRWESGSPDRTIDGEWSDKQPANVERAPLTREDFAALSARVGPPYEPDPKPTLTPEQMANYTPSSEELPQAWQRGTR